MIRVGQTGIIVGEGEKKMLQRIMPLERRQDVYLFDESNLKRGSKPLKIHLKHDVTPLDIQANNFKCFFLNQIRLKINRLTFSVEKWLEIKSFRIFLVPET